MFPGMPASQRADRLHKELLHFLVEAHTGVIGEQDGAAFAKHIESIRTLIQRLPKRYVSADEKKLLKKLRDMPARELREVAPAFRDVYGSNESTTSPAVTRAATRSIRVGSWMGGDRDGNSFVTAEITKEARLQYRAAILQHYREALDPLIDQLTVSDLRKPIVKALASSIERASDELPELRARFAARNTPERYRLKLNAIGVRLE